MNKNQANQILTSTFLKRVKATKCACAIYKCYANPKFMTPVMYMQDHLDEEKNAKFIFDKLRPSYQSSCVEWTEEEKKEKVRASGPSG